MSISTRNLRREIIGQYSSTALEMAKKFYNERLKSGIFDPTGSINYSTLAKVAGAVTALFSVVGATFLLRQPKVNSLVLYSDKFSDIFHTNPSLYRAVVAARPYHNLEGQIEEERDYELYKNYLNSAQVDLFRPLEVPPREDFRSVPLEFCPLEDPSVPFSFPSFPSYVNYGIPTVLALALLKIGTSACQRPRTNEEKEIIQNVAKKLENTIEEINKELSNFYTELNYCKETSTFSQVDRAMECLKIKELFLLCYCQKTIVESLKDDEKMEFSALIRQNLENVLRDRQEELLYEMFGCEISSKELENFIFKFLPEIPKSGKVPNDNSDKNIYVSKSYDDLMKLTGSVKDYLKSKIDEEQDKISENLLSKIEKKQKFLNKDITEKIIDNLRIKPFS